MHNQQINLSKSLFLLVGLILFLMGCGANETSPTQEPITAEPTMAVEAETAVVIDVDSVPAVDTSIHSVPLEEIYFDTFRSTDRAVPLTRADEKMILQLRDTIPPIYEPIFETAVEADKWLRDSSLILGYTDGDQAYAYPINILNYHEIVRHTVNGRPILATYCPLCQSGVVYDSRVNGETLIFGNTSALYQSDMVMLDHSTGSYWVQVSGEAVVGTMTGERLTPLPSQTTTWAEWVTLYPDTLSLSRETGFQRSYNRNPFSGYRERLQWDIPFAFPVSDEVADERLLPGEIVLGVEWGEARRAYALERLGNVVINDTLADAPIVIFSKTEEEPTGVAYLATVDGELLTFGMVNGRIRDEQTKSLWDFNGLAKEGELAGTQLEPLPIRTSLWFGLVAAFPDIELTATAPSQ